MFDFDLNARFWRSATEAMFEGAAAAFAAATTLNEHFTAPPTSRRPEPVGFAMFDPMGWFTSPNRTSLPAPSFELPYASNTVDMFNPYAWLRAWMPTNTPLTPCSPEQWMQLYSEFWTNSALGMSSASPWAMWRTPLTVMMMSIGMPYAVASPAARASAASMEAADAARQQMAKAFAAYRTDGGHASAQLTPWPLNLMGAFDGHTGRAAAKQKAWLN